MIIEYLLCTYKVHMFVNCAQNIKRLLETKMSGRRHRGRPHTQWTDHIRRDVEGRGETGQ
jgi:hypothetical protein